MNAGIIEAGGSAGRRSVFGNHFRPRRPLRLRM